MTKIKAFESITRKDYLQLSKQLAKAFETCGKYSPHKQLKVRELIEDLELMTIIDTIENHPLKSTKATKRSFKRKLNIAQDNINAYKSSKDNQMVIDAIKLVQAKIPTYKPCNINIVNGYNEDNKQVNGTYYKDNITLYDNGRLNKRTIIHEIGHHVHDIYYNSTNTRIATTTTYSNTNSKEKFAEAFMLWITNHDKKSYQKGISQVEKYVLAKI